VGLHSNCKKHLKSTKVDAEYNLLTWVLTYDEGYDDQTKYWGTFRERSWNIWKTVEELSGIFRGTFGENSAQ